MATVPQAPLEVAWGISAHKKHPSDQLLLVSSFGLCECAECAVRLVFVRSHAHHVPICELIESRPAGTYWHVEVPFIDLHRDLNTLDALQCYNYGFLGVLSTANWCWDAENGECTSPVPYESRHVRSLENLHLFKLSCAPLSARSRCFD